MKYIAILILSCSLDWQSAGAFVGESVKAYGEIERQRRIVGYDYYGNPIYR